MLELEAVLGMLKDAYEEGFIDCSSYSETNVTRFLEDNWNNSNTRAMIKE